MFTDPVVQWGFTVLFSALTVYSVLRVFVDGSRSLQAIGHALHAVMAADMATMAWLWWAAIPSTPQLVFFVTAAVWYAIMLVLQASRRVSRRTLGGHGAWHQAVHVVMMLAMVWMVAVMADADPSASGHDHSALPIGAALTGVAVTAGLIVAGAVFVVEFVDCVRGGKRTWAGHTGDVASGALMCLGMAAMCLPMLVG
ncbi:DUF5134 domain-containing protein [Leucobacter sp. GX24907]